jgi:hypothetical protein
LRGRIIENWELATEKDVRKLGLIIKRAEMLESDKLKILCGWIFRMIVIV